MKEAIRLNPAGMKQAVGLNPAGISPKMAFIAGDESRFVWVFERDQRLVTSSPTKDALSPTILSFIAFGIAKNAKPVSALIELRAAHFKAILRIGMDWQQMVSLTIVCAAGGFLLASKFRRRTFDFQRDTHCGCSAGPPSPNTIVFRARKGHQPEVHVKMR